MTYTVKYKVKNIFGWSTAYSPTLSILAATVPSEPLNVASTNSAVDTSVRISWDAPTNSGGTGVVIISYKILLRKKDGTFIEDKTSCDGSLSTTISNRYCDILMAKFLSSTFNLAQGDEIVAKVTAFNSIGESVESSLNVNRALV